ncbi:MAG: type VI secretion system contractile sheath domain-containing protein, partial [Candidatus Competibacterales bacterium]
QSRGQLRDIDELRAKLHGLATDPPKASPKPPSSLPLSTSTKTPAPAGDVDDFAALGNLPLVTDPSEGQELPATPNPAAERFIRRLLAPHLETPSHPRRQAIGEAIDKACADGLRAVLHHPDFQALEARWRLVYDLTSRLDNEGELKLFLVDVRKDELVADPDGGAAKLQQILSAAQRANGTAWSLWVTDFSFGPSAADVDLLTRLGGVAQTLGAPLVGQADSRLLGLEKLNPLPPLRAWPPLPRAADERWQRLRHSDVAPWLGLILPRLLVRLPYESKVHAIDAFDFEELPAGFHHEALLWGAGSLTIAALIGQSFLTEGWNLRLGDHLELDDLPAYTHRSGSELSLQPCAEVLLNERAVEMILAQGLMPLLSHRNHNAVRLAHFQSVADPLQSLAGPWQ